MNVVAIMAGMVSTWSSEFKFEYQKRALTIVSILEYW